MKTYEVNITITSNGQARIKAGSLEEAVEAIKGRIKV